LQRCRFIFVAEVAEWSACNHELARFLEFGGRTCFFGNMNGKWYTLPLYKLEVLPPNYGEKINWRYYLALQLFLISVIFFFCKNRKDSTILVIYKKKCVCRPAKHAWPTYCLSIKAIPAVKENFHQRRLYLPLFSTICIDTKKYHLIE
jgi:hypothetical protein